jgi:hypothetical protein
MIKHKLESAALAYLASTGLTTLINIYTGSDNLDVQADEGEESIIQRPCVILTASDGEEAVAFTGVFKPILRVSIEVIDDDTTGADHRLMCSEVQSKFLISNLPALLNAAGTNFTCLGYHGSITAGEEVSGRKRASFFDIPLACSPATL